MNPTTSEDREDIILKIIDKGKEVLSKYLRILDDPDLKFVAGIKEDKEFKEI